jgi:hypothetical protein
MRFGGKKQTGLVLKLDFKKAYDKVNWSFLHERFHAKVVQVD